MLGTGKVPAGASNVANRGRWTREVAAEFLTKKLWTVFATDTAPPAGVADGDARRAARPTTSRPGRGSGRC